MLRGTGDNVGCLTKRSYAAGRARAVRIDDDMTFARLGIAETSELLMPSRRPTRPASWPVSMSEWLGDCGGTRRYGEGERTARCNTAVVAARESFGSQRPLRPAGQAPLAELLRCQKGTRKPKGVRLEARGKNSRSGPDPVRRRDGVGQLKYRQHSMNDCSLGEQSPNETELCCGPTGGPLRR